MDPATIIILSLIISAFLLFAAVLAYGDYASGLARREKEAATAKEPEVKERKAIPPRAAA
jgi:hypothetical protein